VDRGRPGGQVPVGRHHADEQQRFGRTSGFAVAGHGSRSTATTIFVVVSLRRLLQRLQRSQHPGPAAIATASTATGVQPESPVRSAERVADKQSKNDAGQHVRQTPPAIAGRFLLATSRRRPLFLGHGLVRIVVLLLLWPRKRRTAVVVVVPVVVVVVVAVFRVCRGGHRRFIVRTLQRRSMHCTFFT